MRIVFSLVFILLSQPGFAQFCPGIGQNPLSAFPVCGTDVFQQSSVPICEGQSLPSQCSGFIFTDKNPYWYRFTCFATGTLAFTIKPNTPTDDYDWQLFDITGRQPADVYSDPSLFVACNWSGEGGNTGASANGTSLVRCEGPGVPLFSSMPTLIQGHTYLLMVSHFTDSQSGYSLSFDGGTANITDIKPPGLDSASAACDGTSLSVKLNKKMKCNSLALNGSDFLLSPAVANIISAAGVGCGNGFDMDSVVLTLSSPLPPGTYSIIVQNGSDANSVLDNCDNGIPSGTSVNVTVFPLVPTPMDSLIQPKCAPDKIELVFRKKMRCSSVAADGSDFLITGSYPVSISGAAGNCNADGLTDRIIISFSQPLQVQGNFSISLRPGSDGSTIIDECGQVTPAGASLPFSVADTVNADFNYSIRYGCNTDTINYFHNGANGVNVWTWTFDTLRGSNLQSPEIYYGIFGTKTTTLIVSNGTCSDTTTSLIELNNGLKAEFLYPAFVCPGDPAEFSDASTGTAETWLWDFGNGNTWNGAEPPQQFYNEGLETTNVPVTLTVTNNFGCVSVASHAVLVVNNCFIAVPTAFTPNGDGRNDYLYPLNAYKAKSLTFSIYNRFGQRMFTTSDWLRKWDGKFNGREADPGTYTWFLRYINTDNNQPVFQKGTTILIR